MTQVGANLLKDVIKVMIRRGYFQHFIETTDNTHNDERREHNRWLESPKEAKELPQWRR